MKSHLASSIFVATLICPLFTATAFPLSVTNATAMTPEMLESYVTMFFMPVEPASIEDVTKLNFYVNYPPVRERVPERVYEKVQPYNFLSMPFTLSSVDPDVIIMETGILPNIGNFKPNDRVIRLTMEKIFSLPRNRHTHQYNREVVGSYIYEKFGRSGLISSMQDFEHEMPLKEYAEEFFGEDLSSVTEPGTNIIGILPGKNWETIKDRPILVGAHWDSIANTTGFDDNGSGVSVMLEVARVIATSKVATGGESCLIPDHSIIFVAFDGEEPGSFGSYQFIRTFLMPRLVRKGIRLQGAFILDTIMNLALEEGGQDVPENWFTLTPDAAEDIVSEKKRGNFLAVVGRSHPQERKLHKTFVKWWNKVSEEGVANLRTVNFELKNLPHNHQPTTDELLKHNYFWLSDHSRFWYYNERNKPFTTFPALLFTDTAFHRGHMRHCYHSACDVNNEENIGQINYKFLTKTAQALIWTIVELSTEDSLDSIHCLQTSNEPSTHPQPMIEMIEKVEEHLENSIEPIAADIDSVADSNSEMNSSEVDHSDGSLSQNQQPKLLEKNDIGNEVDADDDNELESGECQENFCPGDLGMGEGEEEYDYDDENQVEATKHNDFGRLGFAQPNPSVIGRMNLVHGPQINIENFHFDMSKNHQFELHGKKGAFKKKHWPDILLGSGSVDPNILASVIESFYGGMNKGENTNDRRKYKGKHQSSLLSKKMKKKNSPMYIRIKSED